MKNKTKTETSSYGSGALGLLAHCDHRCRCRDARQLRLRHDCTEREALHVSKGHAGAGEAPEHVDNQIFLQRSSPNVRCSLQVLRPRSRIAEGVRDRARGGLSSDYDPRLIPTRRSGRTLGIRRGRRDDAAALLRHVGLRASARDLRYSCPRRGRSSTTEPPDSRPRHRRAPRHRLLRICRYWACPPSSIR